MAVPSVLLLGVEGSVCLLDPALMDWFAYSPREKVKLSKVRREENKVAMDPDIMQASSPLNASQGKIYIKKIKKPVIHIYQVMIMSYNILLL